MKVVINTCYGGFGLSNLAIKRLCELGAGGITPHEHPTDSQVKPGEDLGDGYFSLRWCGVLKDGRVYSWDPDCRTDVNLIKVIEEIGALANGGCAELTIVEVPDGCNWDINDYGGKESVHEIHRSWR